MARKEGWLTAFLIGLLLVWVALPGAVNGDEGTKKVVLRIGEPIDTVWEGCEPLWIEMTAMNLVRRYEDVPVILEASCIDWGAFSADVLPLILGKLADTAATFGEMVNVVLAQKDVMAQTGVLDVWEDYSEQIVPWPFFPPELPWPWPWPNCIIFTHALQAGGAIDQAVAGLAGRGPFPELVTEDPAFLADVVAGAILDAATLITSKTYAATMEMLVVDVVPIMLPRIEQNLTLREDWVRILDKWGELGRTPEVAVATAAFDDAMPEESQEIRDWYDYAMLAAALIAAAAACM
jgi:hypothetical protein